MEFVLNTTTSTPFTSRSGSVMNFGDYREDEEASEATALQLDDTFIQYSSDSEDEDKALLDGFNILSARHRLTSYDHCTKIALDLDQQKGLQLEVGIHVSDENPWKQIRKQILFDHLPEDESAAQEIKDFRTKLSELEDDDIILVGYAPALTDVEDADAFLFYANVETAKESVSLIQRLEAFDRQKVNKTIFKYPRPWRSLGSEKEIDLQVEKKRKDRIEVEVQRFRSSNAGKNQYSYRFADDVRDGYVELVPKKENFDVIRLRTVSVGVQSAAQRVESEQQTNPTFPANAWTQYLYEIEPDPNFAEKDEDNDSKSKLTPNEEEEVEEAPVEKISLPPSEPMKQLLSALEFNVIDMYRDDYALIESHAIKRYETPEIVEVCCFIDLKICYDRFVNAFAWHPTLSGVFVASYTYKTMNVLAQDLKLTTEEISKKLVMESCPVLLWSFDDTLYPKLILEAPREITFLSFCPYDEDVLIGGMVTGQLVIWDLKDRLFNIENPDDLTDDQEKNRERLHSFMNWSKFKENLREHVVQAAAITPYDLSHTKPVTSIKWLNRKHSIATTGLIQEAVKPNELFRQFVSASLDGTISFWDLDYINPNEPKRTDAKRKASVREVPIKNISPYARLNDVIRPVYTIACEKPISSLIFDEGRFSFEAKEKNESGKFDERIEFNVIHEIQEKASNRLIISSLLGTIDAFIWEGFLCKEGKPEYIKQIETFGAVHNGPVLLVERNPFISDVLLSIGQRIFAVWSESNQSAPILWRRRESNISCAQWSSTKVSMFFIARYDGMIELWNLLTRTDCPSISYNAGATLITVITQHKLSLPTDVLLIADKKANLRVFTLPSAISKAKDGDCDRFKEFIADELNRKANFGAWQQKNIEKNSDLKEAKQLLREESRKTLESDKESKLREHRTSIDTKYRTSTRKIKPKPVYDLPDRLRQKWEDMNVKRLMKAMLVLKQFDPETIAMHIKPEKDRLAYNKLKEHAIEENFCNIQHEISDIRTKLIPVQDADDEAERMDFIEKNVDNMISARMKGFKYGEIENDLNGKLKTSKSTEISINWHELLFRAYKQRFDSDKMLFEKQRRAFVGKSVELNDNAIDIMKM